MSTEISTDIDLDPIMVEIFRTRLEAIASEAGAAIENTAISPVITETKDYSVTILDREGNIIQGAGALPTHYGAAMHAVKSTVQRHRGSIESGDVFVANDPHSDGGLHPQDVVIQRPVFVGGELTAWVAMDAHMLDMGGMVPGSSATKATECYQEALRFPSVRLFSKGVEATDMWEVLRANLRSFDSIEMDLRSLVVGSHVAHDKLVEFIESLEPGAFDRWASALDATTGAEIRRRLALLEHGSYSSTAWVEVSQKLYEIPCTLRISGSALTLDLSAAPPQIPHYVNTKPYILLAGLIPALHGLMAYDLPLTQSMYDVLDIVARPGSIVDSRPPAPIGAAQMDCSFAVIGAAMQCLQFALAASPDAKAPDAAGFYDAQGTTRWWFSDDTGNRRLFVFLDGVAGGSSAAGDRDGLDVARDIAGRMFALEIADIEVLESIYPILFGSRGVSTRPSGIGRHRSGGGCSTTLGPHGTEALHGNMTGTRGWFPSPGMAGGHPGAVTSFEVVRSDGSCDRLDMHATDVTVGPGERFVLNAASGGGYGDALDRDPLLVAYDVKGGRTSVADALRSFGVVIGPDGHVDEQATAAERTGRLGERLVRALPAKKPVSAQGAVRAFSEPGLPLFPGVKQQGRLALSERSRAVLAEAPDHWTDGCPVLEEPFESPGPVELIQRCYLDPGSGHVLHAELVPRGAGRSFAVEPLRWAGGH